MKADERSRIASRRQKEVGGMRLSFRQSQIVNLVSRARCALDLDDVAGKMGVSVRTIYNDINAINDHFAAHNAGLLRVASRRVSSEDVDWSHVFDLIAPAGDAVLASDDRRIMMLLGICCGGGVLRFQPSWRSLASVEIPSSLMFGR